MKNLVGLILVGALVGLLPQQASAWCNFKFGVGLNMEWSSGNNSWCGGKWFNNGPYTGGQDCGPMGCGPMGNGQMGYGYGDFGAGAYGGPMQAMNFPPMPTPAPAPQAAPSNPAATAQMYNYGAYQPVSYQYPGYYYPPANGYYYTGYYGW